MTRLSCLSLFIFLLLSSFPVSAQADKASNEIKVQTEDPTDRLTDWYLFVQNKRTKLAKYHKNLILQQYQSSNLIAPDSVIQGNQLQYRQSLIEWIAYRKKRNEPDLQSKCESIDRSFNKWSAETEALKIDLDRFQRKKDISETAWHMKEQGLKNRLFGIQNEIKLFHAGKPVVTDPELSGMNNEFRGSPEADTVPNKQGKKVSSEFKFYRSELDKMMEEIQKGISNKERVEFLKIRLEGISKQLRDRELEEPDLSMVEKIKADLSRSMEILNSIKE